MCSTLGQVVVTWGHYMITDGPVCAVKSGISLTHLYPGIGTEVMENSWFSVASSDARERNHIISRTLTSRGNTRWKTPYGKPVDPRKWDWDSLVEKLWSGSV